VPRVSGALTFSSTARMLAAGTDASAPPKKASAITCIARGRRLKTRDTLRIDEAGAPEAAARACVRLHEWRSPR
jgi:hypothetical protein